MEVGFDGNECIATLRIHIKKEKVGLISVYSHTLHSKEQIKDTFYEKLNLMTKILLEDV